MSTSARVNANRSISAGLFWMSETKGRNREDTNRGCCLSIALHPNHRMTVNRPWTYSPTAAVSATAAISAEDNSNNSAPFARASEADRNCAPGYSWLPHLYQDNTSLAERSPRWQRNFKLTKSKNSSDLFAGNEQILFKPSKSRMANHLRDHSPT